MFREDCQVYPPPETQNEIPGSKLISRVWNTAFVLSVIPAFSFSLPRRAPFLCIVSVHVPLAYIESF